VKAPLKRACSREQAILDATLRATDTWQAMSLEHAEVVRKNFEAFNGRDIDAWLTQWHPEGEWYPAMSSHFDGESHRGHAALRRLAEDYCETWVALTLTAEGITEVGARLLVLGRVRARGKGSGVEIERPWAWIVEFRGDKIIRLRAYLDQAEALKAVGLRE
jgi:ketosteroid isomerase-like protein